MMFFIPRQLTNKPVMVRELNTTSPEFRTASEENDATKPENTDTSLEDDHNDAPPAGHPPVPVQVLALAPHAGGRPGRQGVSCVALGVGGFGGLEG
ncbi:hypothetical protein PUR71_02940, partial [Streptomyces sp. SP17BM10]|uniref:hypothetical protein n=1 Tax=Streptomyces sp. SP17BM10 TaxID=3002530 RepID=UPI002E76D274